jgi:hypothetical protein
MCDGVWRLYPVSTLWQCAPVILLICYQFLLSTSSHSFQYSVANTCTALELNAILRKYKLLQSRLVLVSANATTVPGQGRSSSFRPTLFAHLFFSSNFHWCPNIAARLASYSSQTRSWFAPVHVHGLSGSTLRGLAVDISRTHCDRYSLMQTFDSLTLTRRITSTQLSENVSFILAYDLLRSCPFHIDANLSLDYPKWREWCPQNSRIFLVPELSYW